MKIISNRVLSKNHGDITTFITSNDAEILSVTFFNNLELRIHVLEDPNAEKSKEYKYVVYDSNKPIPDDVVDLKYVTTVFKTCIYTHVTVEHHVFLISIMYHGS